MTTKALTEVTPINDAAKALARPNAPGILKRGNSYFADPTAITRRAGWNPRIDFGSIPELAQSIKANGLLVPIRVKRIAPAEGDGPAFAFELIDGDRRLTACELLIKEGHAFPEGIPIIIVDKAQDDVTSLIQMFVSNDGKPFLPMEEAVAYKKMRDAKMTVKQICAAVGRASMHVTEILALVDADESVKQAVESGAIGKTMAKSIAKHAKGDKEAQKALVAEAVSAKGNKGAKRAVTKKLDEARRAKSAKKGRVLKIRALDNDQLSALGASVAEGLTRKLMDAKAMMHKDNLEKWVAQDDKLAAAFAFGALQALKAAAGAKVNLDL